MAGRNKAISLFNRHREILGVASDRNDQVIVYVIKGHANKISKLLKKMGMNAKIVEIDGFTILNNNIGDGDGA